MHLVGQPLIEFKLHTTLLTALYRTSDLFAHSSLCYSVVDVLLLQVYITAINLTNKSV